ncbi:hypothetical protein S83_069251 [Arachis hypogaea]
MFVSSSLQYFNQILTVVLEVLDDSDSSIKELALSMLVEMLKIQKDAMESSVEIVIEKLLNVTKDRVPMVSNKAEHCLNIVLSQHDTFRCLSVIVPLLITEDEKTLVTCINCLTKLCASRSFCIYKLKLSCCRLNGPRVLYSVRMHCISCSLLVVDGLRHLASVAMAKIISKGDGISVYARASSL